MMRKYIKPLLKGVKYAGLLFAGTATVAFTYLQYINAQVGPIQIDKNLFIKHHMTESKISEQQATKLYLWVLFDIYMMRIFTYNTYSGYCQKLQRRIVKPALQRYEEKDLFQKIEKSSSSKDNKNKKLLFKDVSKVREANMQGIVQNEYIIKEIRKQHKLMQTRKLLSFQPSDLEKMNLVHKFICQTGVEFKDPEVMQYVSHVPAIQRKLPGDILHKVMFI